VDATATSFDRDSSGDGIAADAAGSGAGGNGGGQRHSYGRLPRPNPTAQLAFSRSQPDLAGLTEAQAVRAMLDSDAWHDVVKPVLDAMQKARVDRRKVAPAYTCEELESVLLFKMLCFDCDTMPQALDRLSGKRGAEARQLLGFNRPRQSKGQVTNIHSVPSAATMSRYRLSWAPRTAYEIAPATSTGVAAGVSPTLYDFKAAEERRKAAASAARRDLYRRFLLRWIEEIPKNTQMAEQARLMFADGTSLQTIFTCLITNKGVPQNDEPRAPKRCRVKPVFDDKGRMVWDGRPTEEQWEALKEQKERDFRRHWQVTADGGYMPFSAGRNRSGPGYTIVPIVDQVGLPYDFVVGRINESERTHMKKLLRNFKDNVLPVLGRSDGPRVISVDAGLTGHGIRDLIRDIGGIENMSPVSGSKRKRSVDHHARRSAKRYAFVHPKHQTRNWFMDGHRNIGCMCGQGKTSARVYTKQDGRVVPRVECECDNCGALNVTSGRWHIRGGEVRLVNPKNKRDVPDLSIGNPLTYTSWESYEYAKRRRSANESFNTVLSQRFGITNADRRVKRQVDAEADVAMASCLLHLIAHEARKRGRQNGAQTARGRSGVNARPGPFGAQPPPEQVAA
jgi:hypothetical protein